MFRGFAVLGLLLGLAAPVAAQRTGGTGDCDRACLTGIADAYIAALVAHTPSKAPLASNVKFTEQAQVLEVGEGLWKTTTQGPTTFKIAVADPIAGQVGMISGGKFPRDRSHGVHAPVILKERLEPVYQVGRVLPCGPAGNAAGSEEQDPAYDSRRPS